MCVTLQIIKQYVAYIYVIHFKHIHEILSSLDSSEDETKKLCLQNGCQIRFEALKLYRLKKQ